MKNRTHFFFFAYNSKNTGLVSNGNCSVQSKVALNLMNSDVLCVLRKVACLKLVGD